MYEVQKWMKLDASNTGRMPLHGIHTCTVAELYKRLSLAPKRFPLTIITPFPPLALFLIERWAITPKVKTIKIFLIQQPCLSLTKTIGKCHVKETSCSISLQYCMLHRYSSGINLVPRIVSVTRRLQIEPWDKIARIQSKFVKPTWPLRRRVERQKLSCLYLFLPKRRGRRMKAELLN